MEEFKFTNSIAKLIAKRLYELARDISHIKREAKNGRLDEDKFDRLNKLVSEVNILAEELGTTIIHGSSDTGYGVILVLPSGKSNNKENLGWKINRWKQYFIDQKRTIDMDGLGW